MTEQVDVRIVGDASDAVAATDRVKAAVSESVGAMRSKLDDLKGTSRAAFDEMGDAAKKGADRVESAARETSAATTQMRSATAGASTAFKGMGVAASGLKAAIGSLVAGLSIGAFTAAASKALDYASSLGEVAQQLGVTTRDLQEYRYAATQVGVSQDEMDKGLARLTLTMGKAREGAAGPVAAFKRLSDLLGKDILQSAQSAGDAIPLIADALAKVEDPAKRAALEVALFGKTGQKLDTLLAGGSSAVNELRDAAQSLGIVLSDEQIQNADRTADKLSELKTVLEANIAGAVSDNANSIYRLATAFADLISWAGKAARALRDYGFQAGQTLRAASGWTVLGGRAAGENAAQARANYARAGFEHDAEVAARSGDGKPERVVRSPTPGASGGSSGGGGAGRTGDRASAPAAAKATSMVPGFRDELNDMLDAETNWGANSIALTVNFWKDKIALTRKGSEDRKAVERELVNALHDQRREQIREEAAVIQTQAEMRQTAALGEIEDARTALNAKLDLIDQEEQRGTISNATALTRRADLNRQLNQLDQQEADRSFQIKLEALQAESKIPGLEVRAKRELLRQIALLETQHETAKRVRENQAKQREKTDDAVALQAKRQQFGFIASSWSQALARMATLQQGFGATVKSLWTSLVDVVSTAIARMLERWILNLLAGEAVSKGVNMREVFGHAKVAAAGAFRATAQIPIVGPVLAPIAAAAAFASVMAFSAKDGYDVPAIAGPGIDGKGGQVGIVHPREMILPADIADRFRGGGGGGDTHHWSVVAMDGPSFGRFLMDNKNHVAKAASKAVRDGFRGG